MKILAIISVAIALATQGYAQDAKPENIEGEHISIAQFYRSQYRKIIDSLDFQTLIEKRMPGESLGDSNKIFYAAGFIRGIIEISTYEKYKERPAERFIHIAAIAISERIEFERRGWQNGCEVGGRLGDLILPAYSEYLKSVDDSGADHLMHEIVVKLPIDWDEQAGTGQPATRAESKSEGSEKPQPESEGRSR